MITDFVQNVVIFVLILSQVKMRLRLFYLTKTINDLLELIKQKWQAEAKFGQSLMDKYMDESLEQLFRKEEDK